ncbi:MAG: hypothetical protein U0Y82_14375 [Thermoleophilia bacterium]
MTLPRQRLSIHVADPGYGPGLDPAEMEKADVRTDVEPVAWQPVAPAPRPTGELVFIDGAQQVEAWLTVTDPGSPRPVAGVAFAVAAGAVRAGHGPRAEVSATLMRRAAIVEGERCLRMPSVGAFTWEARAGASGDPFALARRVGQMRAELELELAEQAQSPERLVVMDGRLSFVRDVRGPVIGAVKSHHRIYLEGAEGTIVPQLRVGQRTPLFAIGEDRYSWYQRLPGVGEGGWAGILRGEAPRALGLEMAVHLADRATAELPRYAGRPHRDPRAPQNLMPVMTLEGRLRHRMGDRRLALRAVRQAVDGAELEPLVPAAALHVAA